MIFLQCDKSVRVNISAVLLVCKSKHVDIDLHTAPVAVWLRLMDLLSFLLRVQRVRCEHSAVHF